jgi:hypothetical protein
MVRGPSAELKPPGPRRALISAALWWLLFATTIVAILAGVWRGVERIEHPTGFELVGLTLDTTEDCVEVTPRTASAKSVWPEGVDEIYGGCIVEVGGVPVARSASRDSGAKLLEGPVGSRVMIGIASGEGTPTQVEFRRVAPGGWYDFALLILDTIVAGLYPAVALLLWLRRPNDPVSRRISFAFLLIAHISYGPTAFWMWANVPIHAIFALIGLLILVVTIPAYPDGIYVPRAMRWLRLLVPLSLVLTPFAASAFGVAVVTLAFVGVVLLLVRYFRMPKGLQKQQIKWAVFGVAGGILLAIVSAGLSEPAKVAAGPDSFNWLAALADVLNQVAFGLIPAGVGVSLLEYRLNDADAAVGKSIGYAIVTVVVGVVWAIVQSVVSDVAKRWAGDPMATTAITTVIAALVFTPARSYVLSWTEAKFQPALVRLRKLPEKLVRWQTCDTPEELAQATLTDLVNGIGAAYAAILGDDGREWRLLAAKGIDAERAMILLTPGRPTDRSEDPFPVRVDLAEQLGRPDLLAIGPRSDGASFTRDERSAIRLIVDPLSSALQAAALRERHMRKVENSLLVIDERLALVEKELAPLSVEAASRRSRKGSQEADRSSRG